MLPKDKLSTALVISRAVVLTTLVAITPTVAQAQSRPVVTVVNTDANPVVTRITNAVVPITVSNADPIPIQDADGGEYTHVGQKPSRLVTLSASANAAALIGPDTAGGPLFVVPTGFRFVLTDIEWSANCTNDNYVSFSLSRERPAGGLDRPIRALTPCDSGVAVFERHYTTGQVFGAGQQFTAEGFVFGTSTPVQGVNAQIHGYLVPVD